MTIAKINICCITGTRADYGHQLPLFKRFIENKHYNFNLIVTGSHLKKELGHTVDQIRKDKIPIYHEFEILDQDDSSLGVSLSTARALSGFAKCLATLKPDLLVLFGDRYEMLAAAQSALFMNVPMVHIGGGDITEGAYDNSIRHSLTKFSSLHFPTNEQAKDRIIAMGEVSDHVINVGSLCIDSIKETVLLNKVDLENELGFNFLEKNILVTFHPETSGHRDVMDDLKSVFNALEQLTDVGIIVTKPSLDVEGMHLILEMERYADRNENMKIFSSLGQVKYYSLLKLVDAVIGNSSSGLYEVPSFSKPTVNIGDRQKGRLLADSVISCAVDKDDITSSINEAFQYNCQGINNPYGDGESATQIEQLILDNFDKIKGRKAEHFA
jgi:UDP-hydrolysing UDP-N-acetyl-D-glucosamine 2-epimerase